MSDDGMIPMAWRPATINGFQDILFLSPRFTRCGSPSLITALDKRHDRHFPLPRRLSKKRHRASSIEYEVAVHLPPSETATKSNRWMRCDLWYCPTQVTGYLEHLVVYMLVLYIPRGNKLLQSPNYSMGMTQGVPRPAPRANVRRQKPTTHGSGC